MSKLSKKWAILAAVMGGMMFHFGGCLGGLNRWIVAILNEDLFG
ncbi:MAG TPA: hypothetical protein PKG54_07010 [Phycisphaerae bacterium]|jgi:hypothetical protein|nr:hypothetical protein [Phycisphaerae bacterium]HOL24887.1 hypothetical protein [Phycisphaerae bacterium]HQA46392.1 hypothetical protein [Phycisphaerae bacterium]HQE42173.1 hypothetical protein [Phycisphaerae bacterium]